MKIFWCWLLLSITFSANSQQEQELSEQSKYITTIPFEMLTGGVILFKAQIANEKDSINLILDTGSSGISLDSVLVAERNLTVTPSERKIKGIGGERKVNFVYNQSLSFPNLQVYNLNFHIVNYEILSAIYGIKIDGIVGYSFLSRYIVLIDYENKLLKIFSPGKFKYPRGGCLFKDTVRFLPKVMIDVKDNQTLSTGKYLFDIGAGLTFLLTKQFVEANGNKLLHKKKVYYKSAEGMGGTATVGITTIRKVKIGKYAFYNVPVNVYDDEYDIMNYPALYGLVGSDLMKRFNIYLNYPGNEIFITPNKNYGEFFDYSYSGMELYWIQNKIYVGQLNDDSPAKKAGLEIGDIVLAINNDFSQNFGVYKTLLQETDETVSILIKRGEEMMIKKFKVTSILKRSGL